jgi:hypothetical protein
MIDHRIQCLLVIYIYNSSIKKYNEEDIERMLLFFMEKWLRWYGSFAGLEIRNSDPSTTVIQPLSDGGRSGLYVFLTLSKKSDCFPMELEESARFTMSTASD